MTDYHEPNRPFFDAVEMKGGGEAASAARAVLQTGEYDFAWNLQVADNVLKQSEAGGKGHIEITKGASIEHIQLNTTDPNKEVDGERSSIKTKHPTLSDPAVRQAMKLLLDRASVQKYIYGRTGEATGNYVNGPAQFVSKNTSWEFNVAKAKEMLDKAGYKPGPDGIRAKDGNKLDYVFQTSINRSAPAEPGDRQGRVQAGRHQHQHQGRAGIGVLLLRRRQPRHLSEVLRRYADVHHAAGAARSGDLAAVIPVRRSRRQSQQVVGPQHHPLSQPRVSTRPGTPRRRNSTR